MKMRYLGVIVGLATVLIGGAAHAQNWEQVGTHSPAMLTVPGVSHWVVKQGGHSGSTPPVTKSAISSKIYRYIGDPALRPESVYAYHRAIHLLPMSASISGATGPTSADASVTINGTRYYKTASYNYYTGQPETNQYLPPTDQPSLMQSAYFPVFRTTINEVTGWFAVISFSVEITNHASVSNGHYGSANSSAGETSTVIDSIGFDESQ